MEPRLEARWDVMIRSRGVTRGAMTWVEPRLALGRTVLEPRNDVLWSALRWIGAEDRPAMN